MHDRLYSDGKKNESAAIFLKGEIYMRKNESNNGWMKTLSWICMGICIIVIGRHILANSGLYIEYITTLEWVILAIAGLGELIFGLLPKLAKNRE